MILKDSFRSRKLKKIAQKLTQKLITFQLREEWFALPIKSVFKVIKPDKIYGDPQHIGVSLTKYQDQEILVIDVGYHVFSDQSTLKPIAFQEDNQPQYLVIIQNQTEEIIAFPIDSAPSIVVCEESNFKKLPAKYLELGKIKSISSQILEKKDHPPFFLLDPEKLLIVGIDK